MTYYDWLNVFFKRIEQDNLTPSAQLVMLHLLHLNNCLGNVSTFRYSDRYLQNRTGLSKDAITQAKRLLKNKGYLDFKGDKKQATLYILKGEEQGSYQGEMQGVNQDKYLDQDKDLNNKNQARAREELTLPSAEVIETWKKCKGEKLDGAKQFGLTNFEKAYTTEQVLKAILKASESNNYNEYPLLTYNYFKKVLVNQLKGSEKYDGTGNNVENAGMASATGQTVRGEWYNGEDKFDKYFS